MKNSNVPFLLSTTKCSNLCARSKTLLKKGPIFFNFVFEKVYRYQIYKNSYKKCVLQMISMNQSSKSNMRRKITELS
ncbi:hypothetical protein BpHYR1_027019 [Brachionus plicatilis]|uniref:Uncharacterized protein n=1 Tax=Brachionus plicatilis TaxID=10195 RepID=A0A3M7SP97_BRAPC|nr:hypothetical protein BpHYR1_027019 [Brachionus plicatilis]